MTYYNLVFRMGHERFARTWPAAAWPRRSCPTCPSRRSGRGPRRPTPRGVETVLLAAPTAPDERLRASASGRGASSTPSACWASRASGTRWRRARTVIARRLKAVTDKPVLVGVGVSTAEQAVEACAEADGVVIGSALMRRVLDGEGPEAVGRLHGIGASGARRDLTSQTQVLSFGRDFQISPGK